MTIFKLNVTFFYKQFVPYLFLSRARPPASSCVKNSKYVVTGKLDRMQLFVFILDFQEAIAMSTQ